MTIENISFVNFTCDRCGNLQKFENNTQHYHRIDTCNNNGTGTNNKQVCPKCFLAFKVWLYLPHNNYVQKLDEFKEDELEKLKGGRD